MNTNWETLKESLSSFNSICKFHKSNIILLDSFDCKYNQEPLTAYVFTFENSAMSNSNNCEIRYTLFAKNDEIKKGIMIRGHCGDF